MQRLSFIFIVYFLIVGCGPLDFEKGVKVDVRSGQSLPVQVETQGGLCDDDETDFDGG